MIMVRFLEIIIDVVVIEIMLLLQFGQHLLKKRAPQAPEPRDSVSPSSEASDLSRWPYAWDKVTNAPLASVVHILLYIVY